MSPRAARSAVAVLAALASVVAGLGLGVGPGAVVAPSPAGAAEGWQVVFTSTFSGNLPGVGAVSGRISGQVPLAAVDDPTDLVATQQADVLMRYETYSGPAPQGCTSSGLRDGYADGIQVYEPRRTETRFDVLMGLYGGVFPPTGEFLIGAERYSCPRGTTYTRNGAQMWACVAGGVVPGSQGGRGPYYYPLAPGETRTFTGSVPDTGVCPGATGTHTTTITLLSPPLAAPTVPRDVRASVQDTTALGPLIQASWSPPASTGGSPIGAYVVRLLAEGQVVQTQVVDGSQRGAAFRELRYGTRYAIRVSARNGSFVEGPQSAAVGPIVPVPFDDSITFVTRTFQDLVGRSPTTAERNGWASRIGALTATPGDLVAALRTGADGTTNVDPVVRLYRAYFLRDPDVGGFDYWVGQRRRGRSLAWTSDAFVATPEFRARYAGVGNAEFVRRVYDNVLGRAPDQAGLTYWTGEIDSGRRTRGAVMLGFSESAEHRNRLRPHVQVLVQHLSLLDRLPTSREGDAGRELVIGSGGLPALAHDIIGRQEYADRVG